MSINSLSSLSFTPPLFSSNSINTSISSDLACQHSTSSTVMHTIYTVSSVLLLLPLYIVILYMGFQRWWHQRSTPAGMTMSHSDFFTYNMMIVEIFGVFDRVLNNVYKYNGNNTLFVLGQYFSSITLPVQVMFHLLTCMERYLAVVHPITYRHLRESHGIKIRNISTVCVWVVGFGWIGVEHLYWPNFPAIPFFSNMGICILLISFCCLSTLHTLIRPGPGEVGGNKGWVDKSKQRAFHMIVAITGVLVLRFAGILILFLIQNVFLVDTKELCVLVESAVWLSVPCRLVLPLLFLHRAEKLSCCRKKTELQKTLGE
ncbi:hypothetical protein ACER0C_001876 [Sarotherodon galilaeus]